MKEQIERYIAAYNRMDVPGMIALLSEDVLFENVSNTNGFTTTRGKNEFEALARQSLGVFASRRQSLRSMTLGKTTAATEIDFEAVLAIDLPNGRRAGDVISLRGVTIFDFAGGKIARISDYS